MSPAVAAAPATVGAGLCLALAWGMSAMLALGGGYVPAGAGHLHRDDGSWRWRACARITPSIAWASRT